MEQQPDNRDPVNGSEDMDLVGFVLGALEPEEHSRIAEKISGSPELQEAVDQAVVFQAGAENLAGQR